MGVETGIDLDAARRLSWDACLNVRDTGGYATADGGVTRWRALLRSDSLCRLTPEGQAALVDHGVRTIVDLRSPSELAAAPHPFAPPDGAGDAAHAAPRQQDTGEGEDLPRYLSLPLFDEDDEAAGVALAGIDDHAAFYSGILDLFAGRIGAAIAAVADAPEGGVLVHCHAGKDRTGLVVALALALAGVPRATIAADYALSDAYLQPLYAEMLGLIEDQDERDALAAMLASRPETMLAALAHLDERHGGVEPYLRAAGVTDEQIEQVRRRLRADGEGTGSADGEATGSAGAPAGNGQGGTGSAGGDGFMATVREATPADAAGIARVHVDAWRATYRGIVPDDHLDALSYEGREAMWTGIFAAGDTHVFVAEDGTRGIVGFASGGPERSSAPVHAGELYAIYLLDAYHGQGLGRRLVRAVADRLARDGAASLLVWVAALNPARRFYERLGGTRVRAKHETIGGAVVEEIAYGWTDIRALGSGGEGGER